MSRFTKSAINWKEIEQRVPLDQKNNFFAFKGKSVAYLRRVQANPSEPPKIDWEAYKKMVPIAGLVDKFKQNYESLKIPIPPDTMSSKVDEQWKSLEVEIKAYCAKQQKIIDSANQELVKIKALPKFDEMTMEMFKDLYPELAIDPVNKPTFWPHTPEDQLGYTPPKQTAKK